VDDKFSEAVQPVLQTDGDASARRRQTDADRNHILAVAVSPTKLPSRTYGRLPEVDEVAEISPVSREQHYPFASAIAYDSVAKPIAAHAHRVVQRGAVISVSGFRGTPTGSGNAAAELGRVVAAGVEYLDAPGVRVGGEDSTGSDVIGQADRRPEEEVAWPNGATELTYLHSHVTNCIKPYINNHETTIKTLTPTVAIWVRQQSIMCQTGLNRHL